ncbi:uncharacterized protein LOC131430466 [Malaya genurostris]|uniref:uncharacterized protein LOC131430466 n=1 Tax=Malaya genurostris TaxID=325434 RepID=UPI0026F3D6A9|nr:uncharacterized protein LOC131430466 [Malaya genurostris]
MAGSMDELLVELNYDFNYLLHDIRTAMRKLDQSQRRTVEAWLHKLSNTNQSLEEIRLRNDFLFYLSRNCEDGNLLPPFDQKPPAGYALDATHLMPSLGTAMTGETTSKPIYEAQTGSPSGATRRAELFQRSPDGGAFLVSQPVPRCGAFCYLAIVSKQPKS